MHRRTVLRALASLGLTSTLHFTLGCRSSNERVAGPTKPTATPRPRHLVIFFIRGGLDAVLTTAPKHRSRVDAQVDVPYAASEIFRVSDNSYGPYLRPLERHLKDIAIVNGVFGGSVQHGYAAAQLIRMKMRVSYDVPSVGEVIGGHLAQHPLTNLGLGRVESATGFFPAGMLSCVAKDKYLRSSHDLCDDIIEMSPEQLELAADGLDQLAGSPDVGPEVTRSARGIAALMRKVRGVAKPPSDLWLPEIPKHLRNPSTDKPVNAFIQRDCQRALWVLENELSTSITIQLQGVDFDSHTNNYVNQGFMSNAFFPVLARFLDELAVRRNAHGTLASQTVVMVSSELGRLPRLNDQDGKDHFPEFPMMFFGPRIKTAEGRGAVYGEIGRRMEAYPINLKTGRASATGSIPTLTDIGATLLSVYGIDPRAYGYTGRALDFLVEA